MHRSAGRPAVALAALLTLLPTLAGCAGVLGSSSSPSSAAANSGHGPVGTSVASRLANGAFLLQQAGVTAKPPAGFNCSSKSLRGCFSESTMTTYFAYVLPIVDKFFESTWPSLKLPAHVYFIPNGVQVSEGCTNADGSHTADETAYAFCPGDGNVYVGQHTAYQLYSLAGDVAPAIGIAHEFGHNVQQQTGVPAPQTDAETLVHENQADCVSGAWLGFANNQHLLEQGDVPAIERYLELIASSENDPNRTHGDFAERGQSIETGGEKNVSACNAFYPSTPIIKS